MWSPALGNKRADDLKYEGLGRIHHAECASTVHGTGCALIVRSDVPIAKTERTTYARPDGKALAVHLTWHGRKLIVLITHQKHTDTEQAAFYQSLIDDLRTVYSTPHAEHPEDYHPNGNLPADREIVWMADQNHVDDPSIDSHPPNSAPHRPQATHAKALLTCYLRNVQDVYRTIHPDGRSTTREADTHASRIDTIHTSPTMLQGERRFIRATHITPEEYAVYLFRDQLIVQKASDHSLVRLMYRSSTVERQKPTRPTFPNEIMHTPKARARLVQITNQILTDDTHPGPTAKHEALLEAWMKTAHEIKKEESGDIRLRIAAAKRKMDELQRQLLNTQNPKAHDGALTLQHHKKRAYQEQIKRARKKYHAALYERQEQHKKRRLRAKYRSDGEDSHTVHKKVNQKQEAIQPVEEATTTSTNTDGTQTTTTAKDNEGIHAAFISYWEPILQMQLDEEKAKEAEGDMLSWIKEKMANRLTDEERSSISMAAILTRANIRDAIRRIKANTAPGQDGIPIEPYLACIEDGPDDSPNPLVDNLLQLYQDIQNKQEMPANMRESTTTMIYKGPAKGPPSNAANYRPITVTSTEYRILATAMAQRLAEVLHRIVGETQIGFQIHRDIGENIDLMTEALRYANHDRADEEGAIAILDNAHAFDYVAWPFIWKTLEAFHLPPCFIGMIRAMTTNISTRLKINGTLGPTIQQKSGIRQGCPLSSMIYLLVMEVLLHTLRRSDDITGMTIPDEQGRDTHTNTTQPSKNEASLTT